MADPAREFLSASDSFLAKLEAAGLVDKKEEEATRKSLVRSIKADAKAGASNLGTVKIGGSKILVPTSPNLRAANLISERTRRRMSDFSLTYLNPRQVARLKANGSMDGLKVGEFVRHSRRSARHMREFLGKIGELEPGLQEEIDATLAEMNDAKNDLLKLEIRSFTQMRERLIRSINGREKRSALIKEIDAFDINRSIWNLSLLEHPKASVQQMLARSSTKMGSRVTDSVSRLPKVSHVMVGLPPVAQKKMTPSSRTASLVWRIFSQDELDRAWEKLPQKQQAQGSWRGLGLSYNTAEWYVPVPPEIVDDLRPLVSARRAAALAAARKVAEKSL